MRLSVNIKCSNVSCFYVKFTIAICFYNNMNYKLSDTGFLFIIIASMKIKTKKNFNKGFQSIRIEGLQIMNNIHDDFLTFRCLSSIALCLFTYNKYHIHASL